MSAAAGAGRSCEAYVGSALQNSALLAELSGMPPFVRNLVGRVMTAYQGNTHWLHQPEGLPPFRALVAASVTVVALLASAAVLIGHTARTAGPVTPTTGPANPAPERVGLARGRDGPGDPVHAVTVGQAAAAGPVSGAEALLSSQTSACGFSTLSMSL